MNIDGVDVLDKVVLPGVLFGAMLPFVFAALTMLSVGRAAESVMWECRDQLNRKFFPPNEKLDAQKCVRICSHSSLREMVPPGTLAVVVPVVIGMALGPKGLLGLLLGAISSGFLLAVMMSNAGGAWDNAKKWVEKGGLGKDKGKHSLQHKATVVGDTVGDPFKDTSGPSLNILIKLMSIVSLVIAPILVKKDENGNEIPKSDWEDWWAALIIIAVLMIFAWIYKVFMSKYGYHHDTEFIGKEAERRKAAGKGTPRKASEAKSSAEQYQESGGDVGLDNLKNKKPAGRLPGDSDGGYGSL